MQTTSARSIAFENKFTTGNLVAMAGPMIVLIGGLIAMQSSLTRHDAEISDLKTKVAETRADHDLLIRIDTKLASVLEQLARQRAATERTSQ